MQNQDMLLALAEELDQSCQDLNKWADELFGRSQSDEYKISAGSSYLDFLTRFSNASEAIGVGDLRPLLVHIEENIKLIADKRDLTGKDSLCKLVCHWPEAFSTYLKKPGELDCIEQLKGVLLADSWLKGFGEEKLDQIMAAVNCFVGDGKTQNDHSNSLGMPTEEDISLEIPADVNPKLLQSLQIELPANINQLSELVQIIYDKKATLEDIGTARRIAHTLKGVGNIVGVPGIANVSHRLEEMLEYYVEKNGLPVADIRNFLAEAADCLAAMSDFVLGQAGPPENALQVLTQLYEWIQKLEEDQTVLIESFDTNIESDENERTVNDALSMQQAEFAVKPAESERSYQHESGLLDSLFEMSGELANSNYMLQGRLHAIKSNSEKLGKFYSNLKNKLNALREITEDESLKRVVLSGNKDTLLEEGGKERFSTDQYEELKSIGNLLTEMLDDMSEYSQQTSNELAETNELFRQQEILIKELTESITSERMVPAKSLLPRLQRIVRQMSRSLNKKVELIVCGEALKIDSSILEVVTNPLLHILRNAIDHGIEAPTDRLHAGKPEIATITVSFLQEGNNISISCEDDGSGVDLDAVRETAIRLNLINSYQMVNDKELMALILQSGFSTRQSEGQISGRGVGMGEVQNVVNSLHGRISVESKAGLGVKVIMTVPSSLSKANVLLLASKEFTYGIIASSFEEIVDIAPDQLTRNRNELSYVYGDNIYTVRFLHELLGINDPSLREFTMSRSATISSIGDEHYAVLLDNTIGGGEMFLKKISKYVPRLNGIVGMVTTNRGVAAPVFDLQELVRKPSPLIEDYLLQYADQSASSALNVLIVDDSSSARRSLTQVAEDAGFDVRTAIDGMEAISLIEEKQPDILLTDLEMPKMNGLELVAKLRSSDDTRDLPVVMVTSRSTEKHRAQAMSTGIDCYITKPYTNEDLINQMGELLSAASNRSSPAI